MRKSNILHKYAKEKDILIISLLSKHKTVIQNTKRFQKNDPAYEKFTRLKQEKPNDQLFLAEFHPFTHDNTFAFQQFICLHHPISSSSSTSWLSKFNSNKH